MYNITGSGFKKTDDFYTGPTPLEVDDVLTVKSINLSKLSEPNVFASLGQIFLEYAGIAAAIWLCSSHWSFLLYIVTVMFIACRQHALGVILHDGVHFKISKNRKLNDFITEYLIAIPIFTPMLDWRRAHFTHHRDPNTEDDPDWVIKLNNPEWVFPKTKIGFLTTVLKYSCGIYILGLFFNKRLNLKQKTKYFFKAFLGTRPSPKLPNEKPMKPKLHNYVINTCLYATILSAIVYYGLLKGFLIYYIIPAFMWAPLLTRIRSIAEHFGVENDNAYDKSRTMYPTLIDKLFLGASWNINLHLDHHLYPSVPSYRLKKLHNLIKDLPEYKANAHITPNGFYGVFRECTG
jgi:fatty acid desaturase